MDRDALILYLQNVRDLEVAKRSITGKYNDLKKLCKREREDSCLTSRQQNHRERPESGAVLSDLIVFLFSSIMCAIIIYFTAISTLKPILFGGINTAVFAFLLLVFIIAVIVSSIVMCSRISEYSDAVASWKVYEKTVAWANEEEKQRVETQKKYLQKPERDWPEADRYYAEEYRTVCELLEDFYGMNLISSEYRNHLAAIQYIYEVASTTQLSYEQILFQTKIEDGIRRIESKLDQMISQLEDVVYETRCMREENRQSLQAAIRQNEGMLAHLQAVETNSRLTTQYSQLAANYSKANAYFSLANYLKD